MCLAGTDGLNNVCQIRWTRLMENLVHDAAEFEHTHTHVYKFNCHFLGVRKLASCPCET